jgi:hypothetical protein
VIFAAACAIALVQAGAAQGAARPAASSSNAAYAADVRRLKIETLANPSSTATVNPTTVFTITASAAEKSASAQVGVQLGETTVTFGLRAPLNDTAGRAVFADLDGLRNKATATTTLLWTHWLPPLAIDVVGTCRSVAPEAGCAAPRLRRPETDVDRATIARVTRLVKHDTKPLYLASVTASIAPETFDFVLSPALTGHSEFHRSWSLGGTAGVVTRGGLMLTGRYAHTVTYSAQGKHQVCAPLGTVGAIECDDEIIGAPGLSRSELAGGELRFFFGDDFAISPRVNRDIRHHITGVEVPLYFIHNTTGGRRVGITAVTRERLFRN